jgi:glycosyltransferase involved in cell wall biosynthesis
VVDENSTDRTVDIALKYTDKIISTSETSFATKIEIGLKNARGKWLLYLDSDEIITPELAREISKVIKERSEGVFFINRENYFLGTKMYPDRVERLFFRDNLQGWRGEVHESPVTNIPCEALKSPITHHTHHNITSMLEKTNHWSEIEAELRIKANHPVVAWWRLVRIALTVWWHQFIELRVGQYGRPGLFEGYFQIIDKLIVYTKLWEKQQKSLPNTQ